MLRQKKESRPLDDDARQQFSKLSNVTEVYPQIRFITDVATRASRIDFRSRLRILRALSALLTA